VKKQMSLKIYSGEEKASIFNQGLIEEKKSLLLEGERKEYDQEQAKKTQTTICRIQVN